MSTLLQIPSAPTNEQKKHIRTINDQLKKLSHYESNFKVDSRVEVAFQRIQDLVSKGTDLSLEEICKVNELVGCDGRLRGPIENCWSKNNIAIRGYHGAPSEDLEQLIHEYITEYNLSDNFSEPLLKICGAYLIFELLHPFSDGNGRVGRIIAAWLMCSQGYAAWLPILRKLWVTKTGFMGRSFSQELVII